MKYLVLSCFVISLLSLALASDLHAEAKSYQWGKAAFNYPETWRIEIDNDTDNIKTYGKGRLVKLAPYGSTNGMAIMLTMLNGLPKDDEGYNKPALVGAAQCLPLALKLAENKESSIMASYGSIQLSGGQSMSSRFFVIGKDEKEFISLECFAVLIPGRAVFGVFKMPGQRGNMNDNSSYINAISDAYKIIRGIRFVK